MCRPALSALANQASKPIPKPERCQIVERSEQEEREQKRESPPERPILGFRADRAPSNSLDRIEKQVTAIEHGNWKKVDESEIN